MVVIRASLRLFYGILGNMVRRVEGWTFTNSHSLLDTMRGWACHSGGAVAVAPIWHAAPVMMK